MKALFTQLCLTLDSPVDCRPPGAHRPGFNSQIQQLPTDGSHSTTVPWAPCQSNEDSKCLPGRVCECSRERDCLPFQSCSFVIFWFSRLFWETDLIRGEGKSCLDLTTYCSPSNLKANFLPPFCLSFLTPSLLPFLLLSRSHIKLRVIF